MITKTAERALHVMKEGGLVLLIDDVNTGEGRLVGAASQVTPQQVNLMTKIGKGLVSVCLTEDRARKLELPLMVVPSGTDAYAKPFTLSIDYKTNTTGISAFERADTISALTQEEVLAEDFRRPGHLFPLLGKNNGLWERVGVVEAVIDLARMTSSLPIGYCCEVLNAKGEMASVAELQKLSAECGIPILHVSEVVEMRKQDTFGTLKGQVIYGNQLGRKIGFPTANLDIQSEQLPLSNGVYGVKVTYGERSFAGIMNVGVRPTIQQDGTQVHYEVHIFDFNEMIYGEWLVVEVCCYVREEMSFAGLENLISQIQRDVEYVKGSLLIGEAV